MKDYKFGHGCVMNYLAILFFMVLFIEAPNVNTGRLNFDMMVEFLEKIKKG